MKLILSLILLFTIGLSKSQTQQPPSFKIAIFKDVPDDMTGCGNAYYLSEKDKKLGVLLCWTDFDSYLVNINGKPIRLQEKPEYGKFSIVIDELSNKQLDTEYYVLTAVI